jgi:hypothetical protein
MTRTQAEGLEDEALIERVREAFDHPLVQELVDRFEDLLFGDDHEG